MDVAGFGISLSARSTVEHVDSSTGLAQNNRINVNKLDKPECYTFSNRLKTWTQTLKTCFKQKLQIFSNLKMTLLHPACVVVSEVVYPAGIFAPVNS